MQVISRKQLEENGGLYFDHIIDGTNQYPYEIKRCSEEEAISWIAGLTKDYILYADFYASRIQEESLAFLKERLAKEEYRELLFLLAKCGEYSDEFILFKPEEQELTLLVKLSYRELLFSTFYSMDPGITIWSNYEGEFVVFAKERDVIEEMI